MSSEIPMTAAVATSWAPAAPSPPSRPDVQIVGAKHHEDWTHYFLLDTTYHKRYDLLDVAPRWLGLGSRNLLLDAEEGSPTQQAKDYAKGIQRTVEEYIFDHMNSQGVLPKASTWLFHTATRAFDSLKWLPKNAMHVVYSQAMSGQVGVLVNRDIFQREHIPMKPAERWWCQPKHPDSACEVEDGTCRQYIHHEYPWTPMGRGMAR